MLNVQAGSRVIDRKLMIVLLGVAMLAGALMAVLLTGAGDRARAQDGRVQPTVIALPTEVNFHSAAETWIYGSGVTPGTQVTLLMLDGNGVYSDITSLATPFPAYANDDGAFVVKWTVDRWTQSGVGAEGVFSVLVTDEQFNTIGTAPLVLCKHDRGEDESVPYFCSQ